MGAGNFGSPVQLLVLLAIVLLLFGGKRLRNLGSDLGNAIKGFKSSMSNTVVDGVIVDAAGSDSPVIDRTPINSTPTVGVVDAKTSLAEETRVRASS